MVTPYDVIWTENARTKLRKQFRFISIRKQQPLNAEKFRRSLMEFVHDKIATNPRGYPINHPISTDETEYRSVNFKRNYKIIYRIEEENHIVFITNIFHNKRHPSNLKAK